jgi:predicted Kef-type K+ transport protein
MFEASTLEHQIAVAQNIGFVMPGSNLSYSVSRNYPHRSLTTLVILGGLASLAVFSLINYASSGYPLVVLYTTDPNEQATDR